MRLFVFLSVFSYNFLFNFSAYRDVCQNCSFVNCYIIEDFLGKVFETSKGTLLYLKLQMGLFVILAVICYNFVSSFRKYSKKLSKLQLLQLLDNSKVIPMIYIAPRGSLLKVSLEMGLYAILELSVYNVLSNFTAYLRDRENPFNRQINSHLKFRARLQMFTRQKTKLTLLEKSDTLK